MKSSIFDFINRWRHTHGYGVHSPLAYKLVKDCVHPDDRYAFYVDSKIYSTAADYDEGRYLRLLIRLIHTLKCKIVWIPDSDNKIVDIISDTFPKVTVHKGHKMPKNADLIVFFNKPISADTAELLSGVQKSYAVLNYHSGKNHKTWFANHCQEIPFSLILSGHSFDLCLRREGMQHVEYDIL